MKTYSQAIFNRRLHSVTLWKNPVLWISHIHLFFNIISLRILYKFDKPVFVFLSELLVKLFGIKGKINFLQN